MIETQLERIATALETLAENFPEVHFRPAFDEATSLAEEPLAEEPPAEEPLAEEPLAEEPLAEEPLAEEPLAEEPLAEEFSLNFGSKKSTKSVFEEISDATESALQTQETTPAPADLAAIRAAYRKKSNNSTELAGLKAKWADLFEDYDIGNINELTKDQLDPFLKELNNL